LNGFPRTTIDAAIAQAGDDTLMLWDWSDGASYKVEDQTLRVSNRPEDWTALPWVATELAQRGANGAEGFWIPRPWTQVETCPSDEDDPANPSSSLGIAQVFDSDSSRVGQRRGRPLEATIQLDPSEADVSKGLRLVIEGRVARWPKSQDTVLCRAARAYERPACLIGAELGSVSVENVSIGDRLADWRFYRPINLSMRPRRVLNVERRRTPTPACPAESVSIICRFVPHRRGPESSYRQPYRKSGGSAGR